MYTCTCIYMYIVFDFVMMTCFGFRLVVLVGLGSYTLKTLRMQQTWVGTCVCWSVSCLWANDGFVLICDASCECSGLWANNYLMPALFLAIYIYIVHVWNCNNVHTYIHVEWKDTLVIVGIVLVSEVCVCVGEGAMQRSRTRRTTDSSRLLHHKESTHTYSRCIHG